MIDDREEYERVLQFVTVQDTALRERVLLHDSDEPIFDAYVARAMKTFDVPGLALAVVKDGLVVAAMGYGVRTLGEPAPVEVPGASGRPDHFVFAIARSPSRDLSSTSTRSATMASPFWLQ